MQLYKELKLEGESEGFDGETVFELSNGQKWEQAEYYYKYRYKYRPTVKIYKDGMRYYIQIEGIEKIVKIRRIE